MTGVFDRILTLLADGPMHMTLLDPASSTGKDGEGIALAAARAGTHALMVGGSTDVSSENLDELVRHIKDATRLPVIYFPSTAGAMSPSVDAIYFLSALNSRDPRYIIREQAKGAPLIGGLGIETIAMGYILVTPGMKVGTVSKADLITHDDDGIHAAVGYALAAQHFGMRLVYLEAGSGADTPVPPALIRAVKQAIDIPLVVGGGIRTAAQAAAALAAGADILVTGTVAERGGFEALAAIISEVTKRRSRSSE